MKKLKFKILITNIRRIIMSFLFINLGVLFRNKVSGAVVTCYAPIPTKPEISIWDKIVDFCQENVFILLVPLVLIIITIIFATKRIKENKKTTEEGKREE